MKQQVLSGFYWEIETHKAQKMHKEGIKASGQKSWGPVNSYPGPIFLLNKTIVRRKKMQPGLKKKTWKKSENYLEKN